MLNPQISYEGLKNDYSNDPILLELLEQFKPNIFDYFHNNYGHTSVLTLPSLPSPSIQMSPTLGSLQKSFTARYCRKDKAAINELDEYFKLPAEDFDACNPIHWWMGRKAQFPNLFCLPRDILCIPDESF